MRTIVCMEDACRSGRSVTAVRSEFWSPCSSWDEQSCHHTSMEIFLLQFHCKTSPDLFQPCADSLPSQQTLNHGNLPSGSGVAHSILWCFCFAAWALWHHNPPYTSLETLGAISLKGSVMGSSKMAFQFQFISSNLFLWKLSPYSLCGKGKALPAHIQLGFRKNLCHRICSDEMLTCVTKACVKMRFPITPYSVISSKV